MAPLVLLLPKELSPDESSFGPCYPLAVIDGPVSMITCPLYALTIMNDCERRHANVSAAAEAHIQEHTVNCVFRHIYPATTIEITGNVSHGIPSGTVDKMQHSMLTSAISEAWLEVSPVVDHL